MSEQLLYLSDVVATAVAEGVDDKQQQTEDRAAGSLRAFRYPAFATAMLIALLLFAYALIRLLPWAARDGSNGGISASPAVSAGLALLAGLAGLRWSTFFVFAFITDQRNRRRRTFARDDLPLVSIFVPAYNEAETIGPALQSLIAIDYPRFEIIVVDDGSKDETFAKAERYAGAYDHCAVRAYRKPNGGKWAALNFAFHHSVGELVLCVDADSRLDPHSLRRMVSHMADPRVAAVAGQVRVRNRMNVITSLQALEYIVANGLLRMAQTVTATVLVVPGPIGLFRRTALEEVYIRFGCRCGATKSGEVDGPFEGDTFAEDFDLSVALLSLGGQCVYEPCAVSHTKAPEWAFPLINQRYRWCRGTIQVLRKYVRRCRVHPDLLRPRLCSWLAVTYAMELIIVPLMNVAVLTFLAMLLLGGGSLLSLFGWYAAFMLLNLNAAAFFIAAHDERLRTLLVLPIYDLYQILLLNSGLAIAVFDEIRGREMRW